MLGDARQADCSINLLYDVNQLDFLRFVDDQLDAGADLAGLQAAWQAKVGPIGAAGQRIAVTSAGELGGQALFGGAKVENAYDFLAGTGTGAPVITSIFPTLDAYMAQNQILNPTLFGYEQAKACRSR